MTPRGAEHLIAMRMTGQRPAGSVFIQHGDFREPDWWKWADSLSEPELLIRPQDPIDRLDLRCLIGLHVILFLPTWGDREARIYERLQEFAEEIAVMSPVFDLDIGWFWLKSRGRIEYLQRHWLTQYEEAQAECVTAARKGDKAAYAAAKAKEAAALESAPWLR